MKSEDVLAALAAEEDRLERLLESLADDAWNEASLCEGWSIADVVLHLAQTEETVVATLGGEGFTTPPMEAVASVDQLMQKWVEYERGEEPRSVLDRWKKARRAALDGLRAADPDTPVQWAAAPLRPRTLATTRLSEHWIHAMDIADPLGIELPDTDRLWHIARLAHRTIPYAFTRAGAEAPPTVRLELDAPGGERWTFGDDDSECTISGPAGDLCRVAARRMHPVDSGLKATGERVEEVLNLIRTYA